MLERKKKRVRLELTRNRLVIDADITIDWKKVSIFLALLLGTILIITSSLNEDIRKLILEVLLNSVQLNILWKTKGT